MYHISFKTFRFGPICLRATVHQGVGFRKPPGERYIYRAKSCTGNPCNCTGVYPEVPEDSFPHRKHPAISALTIDL